MSEPLIQHVSDTAFLVAHHRAVESARADAAFSDPLAARLAGDRGRLIAESQPSASMTAWTVTLRTSIIDAFVREAIARGVDTVVNLGAGLDTRPYRLELPASLRWIEVDYAHVQELKDRELAGETPRCVLERVRLDLADVPARRELFARIDEQARRVLVLTEGVLPYLDVAQAGALADDVRAMKRVEGWIVDYVSPAAVAFGARTGARRGLQHAPFRFTPPDWHLFFQGHGWAASDTRWLADEGARLGRAPPLPWLLGAAMKVLGTLAPAAKRDGFRRSTGYALLAPLPA